MSIIEPRATDVLAALADHLRRDDEMNDAEREKARRTVRSIVRDKVFPRGTIPKGTTGPVAITMSALGRTSHSAISSPAAFSEYFIEVAVWGRETDELSGAERAGVVVDALWSYTEQYSGPLNESMETQTIKQESGPNLQTLSAKDASGWLYRYRLTWMLGVPHVAPTGAN